MIFINEELKKSKNRVQSKIGYRENLRLERDDRSYVSYEFHSLMFGRNIEDCYSIVR